MHVYFGKEKELLSEWFGIFDWERSIGRTDETGDRYRRQIEQSNTKKWLPSLNTWSRICASQTAQSKSEWKWGSTWFVKSKMSRPELTFTTCGTGGSGARRTFRFWISSRRGALFFPSLSSWMQAPFFLTTLKRAFSTTSAARMIIKPVPCLSDKYACKGVAHCWELTADKLYFCTATRICFSTRRLNRVCISRLELAIPFAEPKYSRSRRSCWAEKSACSIVTISWLQTHSVRRF